jgi:uncharacterized protein YdhG (YjbR/CyaY superfamily)
MQRADYGKPIAAFIAKQPPPLRAVCQALRALIEEAAPDATSALKWGMPWYSLGGTAMMAGISAHASHANLILPGKAGTYPDPDGLLEGESKLGKHLKLRSLDDLPRAAVRRWLAIAAANARRG